MNDYAKRPYAILLYGHFFASDDLSYLTFYNKVYYLFIWLELEDTICYLDYYLIGGTKKNIYESYIVY